jgi:hypothetical protein
MQGIKNGNSLNPIFVMHNIFSHKLSNTCITDLLWNLYKELHNFLKKMSRIFKKNEIWYRFMKIYINFLKFIESYFLWQVFYNKIWLYFQKRIEIRIHEKSLCQEKCYYIFAMYSKSISHSYARIDATP